MGGKKPASQRPESCRKDGVPITSSVLTNALDRFSQKNRMAKKKAADHLFEERKNPSPL